MKRYTALPSDKQQIIRDSFSIYFAGICYINNKNIPDTMTVGSVSAGEYVKDMFERNSMIKNIIGMVVFVAATAGLIVLFAKSKTPEGTVPGNGSNFKGGIGSGVSAIGGIPGPAGITTGSGGLTPSPR